MDNCFIYLPEETKQLVDDFNETVNLDELVHVAAREIVASDNSFWLKTEPENWKMKKNQHPNLTKF